MVRNGLLAIGVMLLFIPHGQTEGRGATPEKGGVDAFGAYEPTPNWPNPLAGVVPGSERYTWGSTAGIFAETPNKIFIVQRGELPLPPGLKPGMPVWAAGLRASQEKIGRNANFILTVDANGKLLDNWTWNDKMFTRPHTVAISPYDAAKHVWIIDDGASQIHEFTNDGRKEVMTLGVKDTPGDDDTHFNRPTGIAWLPDGAFFVSDGYENTRVVKFDKHGKFLLAWGKKGTAGSETRPGYMNTVHSVAVGVDRRVYVADRANNRIQIFDENGKYLDEWKIMSPYYIFATQDAHIWVAVGKYEKMAKFNLHGKFIYSWGTQGGGDGKGIPELGNTPGAIFGVHCVSVDQEGNFYTAEVSSGHAQKFRPRKDADPAKLVGQPAKLKSVG